MVSVPIGVMLLFLMGVGPALPWRRTTPEKMKKAFLVPVVVGLASVLLGFVLGSRNIWPLITFAFAGFVMATLMQEFRKGIAARRRIAGVSAPVALGQILTQNNRRYGGYVVHMGIVVIIVALAISGTYRFEREVTLQRGESMLLGDYGVRFDELWAEEQVQRFVVGSTFTVFHRGNEVGTLKPSMNYYPNSQQPIGTPAVRSTLKEDLYLTLMAFDQEDGRHATIRAIVNPAVPWLWIGGMIVALGAILAVMPQRGSGRPAVSAAEIALSAEPAELAEEPAAVTV
jgi:cytochrome c-type biogenesis protein CcmF